MTEFYDRLSKALAQLGLSLQAATLSPGRENRLYWDLTWESAAGVFANARARLPAGAASRSEQAYYFALEQVRMTEGVDLCEATPSGDRDDEAAWEPWCSLPVAHTGPHVACRIGDLLPLGTWSDGQPWQDSPEFAAMRARDQRRKELRATVLRAVRELGDLDENEPLERLAAFATELTATRDEAPR